MRVPETRRGPIFLCPFRPSGICGPATSISNELIMRIMDRDTNTIMHDPLACMMSQPERIDRGFFQAAVLGEIWVSIIKVLESEFERRIDRLVCGFRCWG